MGDRRILEIVSHLESLGFPFEAADDCPWLGEIEARFGSRLPEPYRELVRTYRWAGFEVGELDAFSNIGDRTHDDISAAPFEDPGMAQWLIPNGLLQIGRLSSGSYDPVCFDTRQRKRQPPLVRVDHEDILLCRRKVRMSPVAEAFEALVLGSVA